MNTINETDTDALISKNLKREIETSPRKKCEIAKEIGVSCSTITQYCKGEIRPSLSTFAKLCKALDISSEDILGV